MPWSALVIPLDTHVARIAHHLGLTRRRDLTWRTAAEITSNLARMDPDDPVRFDFALCHLGTRVGPSASPRLRELRGLFLARGVPGAHPGPLAAVAVERPCGAAAASPALLGAVGGAMAGRGKAERATELRPGVGLAAGHGGDETGLGADALSSAELAGALRVLSRVAADRAVLSLASRDDRQAPQRLAGEVSRPDARQRRQLSKALARRAREDLKVRDGLLRARARASASSGKRSPIEPLARPSSRAPCRARRACDA